MSEVDKDLSERYRAAARDEPPSHVDAAILAAAKRAVGSQPQPAGVPRRLRRWYVPVSLAAVIMLSVIVTLRVERERPEIAMPDSVPVESETKQKVARQAQEPPAAMPASPPVDVASRLASKPAPVQPAAPVFAPDPKPDSAPEVRAKEQKSTQQAPEPGIVAPEPKPARDAMAQEGQRADSLRSADAARGPAASGELASNARREARAMSAPAPAAAEATLAKRDLAPEEWLERIADLRKQQRDREADEQFAEFKRRYPDYKIPEAMTERIAPRK